MNKFLRKVKQKWTYSIHGLWISLKEERSLLALLMVFVVLIGLGFWLKLNYSEWSIIILTIFMTFIIEIINTALEAAVDTISFQYNVKVKKIKDIASSATLLMTIAAIIVSLLIYIPKFVEIL